MTKQTDGLLWLTEVLKSVVKVEPFWAVPWKSHVVLQIKTENKVAWNENFATQQGRAGETHYAHFVLLRLLHGWSQKTKCGAGTPTTMAGGTMR